MNRKGFAPSIILLIVVGVLAVGVGVYFYSYHQNKNPLPVFSAQSSSTSALQPQESASTETSTTLLFVASSTFGVLSWTESSSTVKLDLMGVSIKTRASKADNGYVTSTITLRLRVSNQASTTIFSVPMHLDLLLDELGNFSHPLNSFTFEQTGRGIEPHGVSDQDVVFAVPADNRKTFIFTTGGDSNIFFDIVKNDDGTIGAQKELTSEPPNTIAPPICGEHTRDVPGYYPTIQAAIDAADPGDTVRVAAGTYSEGLGINKSRICLEGAGVDQTIITNSGGVGITVGGYASYVIIKNLTVRGSGVGGCCESGGGIYTYNTHDILIQSCRLTQNNAYAGGGLYVTNTRNLTVDHCLIDNNHVSNIAGGVLLTPQSYGAIFTNDTVVNNSANSEMGGLSYSANQNEDSDLIIKNSIFWGNIGPMTSPMHLVGSTNLAGRTWTTINFPVVSYSDIGGWSGGTGNISLDPLFVSTTDYHLQSSSPATGMGAYP